MHINMIEKHEIIRERFTGIATALQEADYTNARMRFEVLIEELQRHEETERARLEIKRLKSAQFGVSNCFVIRTRDNVVMQADVTFAVAACIKRILEENSTTKDVYEIRRIEE